MTAGSTDRVRVTVRGWLWVQLLIGWLPVWALYASMIVSVHGGAVVTAAFVAARAIAVAALLGLGVVRLTERIPWPPAVRPGFVLTHVAGAIGFATAWLLLASLLESIVRWRFYLVTPAGIIPFLTIGIWLYVAVGGVAYAARATQRAAAAEATAARSQLAALRGQLNPHFLFNALHAVVQLIPVEPARAADAAERLASLLRTASDEHRDLVPLAAERDFVERYLALEQLRFDERLRVRFEIDAAVAQATVPSFVLQTLVENAVRHGAAPRELPTTVTVRAFASADALVLEVGDDGEGADEMALTAGGTGLRRLRERLDALYGPRASLRTTTTPGAGFTAVVRLPFERDDED